MAEAKGLNSIVRSEHISSEETGDNISAKRVGTYGFGTDLLWLRMPLPLIDVAYDYITMSNADSGGNYRTLTFKNGGSGGTTVRTLALTYDASNNVTSVSRT